MSKKARNIGLIRAVLIGGTLGWLGSAIWLNRPIEKSGAIFVFVALIIISFLNFAEQLVD